MVAWLKSPSPFAISLLLVFQVCFFSWPLGLGDSSVSTQQTHIQSCPSSGPGGLLLSAVVILIGQEGRWAIVELLWRDRVAPRTADPDRDPPRVCHLSQVWQRRREQRGRWMDNEKGLPLRSL